MKDIPNIFLDSNIFYTDPFQKNRFNSVLLNLSNSSNIKLYMSDVVVAESKENFRKFLNEKYNNYSKALDAMNKLSHFDLDSDIDNQEEYTIRFESHFDDLIPSIIEVIEFYNVDIKEVVNRSIKEIKPFSKNKQEFRDCMIWLTYKRFILENKITNCYFLSANTKDFYDETGKDLHPALKCEIPQLKVFKSAKELILNVDNLNDLITEEELDIWSFVTITESEIERIINNDLYDEFESRITTEIKNEYEGHHVNEKSVDIVETSIIENIKILNRAYKIIQDFTYFSCDFELIIPTLFSNYEELIEDYISEEYILKISGRVNFTLKMNDKAQLTDIENIKIKL